MSDRKLIDAIITLPEVQEELVNLFDFYEEYLGVKMNSKQLHEEILDMGGLFYEYLAYGNDTDIRERLNDNHTRRMIGRGVPSYGDGDDVQRKFWKDLDAKHKELGYERIEQ